MGNRRLLLILVGLALMGVVASALVRSDDPSSKREKPTSPRPSPIADLPQELRYLEASTKASKSATFRFAFRSVYPPDFDISPKTMRGAGYVAFDLPRVEVRASTFVKEPERGGPVREILKLVRIGDDLFTFPVDAPESESTNRLREYWLKQDVEAADKAPSGFPYAEFGQSLELVLRLPMGYVSSPDSAPDQIDGISLTKFSGEVDLSRAGFTPEEFPTVSYLEERMIPVDVWVDGKGAARRISYSLGLETPLPDNRTGVIAGDYVFDFVEFGETRQVEAPPDADVITVDEYVAYLEEYGAPLDTSPGFPFDF